MGVFRGFRVLLQPALIFYDGIFCRFTNFFSQNNKILAFINKSVSFWGNSSPTGALFLDPILGDFHPQFP